MQHRLVRSLLDHYLKRGGYTGTVSVTLSRARFEVVRKRRKYDASNAACDADFAITLLGPKPLVYVNLGKHRTVSKLALTMRHEAAHIVSASVEHDAGFRRAFRASRFEP